MRTRTHLRWQSSISLLLLLVLAGVLAFLSTRYHATFDWTMAQRHTLSASSRAVLQKMIAPLRVSAYVREAGPADQATRARLKFFVARYQHAKHDIILEFINPDHAPERTRAAGVRLNGELVLRYQDREVHVDNINEQDFTNALQTLLRQQDQYIVFVSGHGERLPLGSANHDLGLFGEQLQQRGFKVQTLELAQTPQIMDNVALLVVASPAVDWLAAEVSALQTFVGNGGNVLLLLEPHGEHGLQPLLTQLGVQLLAGTVVDPTTVAAGIDSPAMALITQYPPHAATQDFNLLTLLPHSSGLQVAAPADWTAAPLLQSSAQAWSETAPLEGSVALDAGSDHAGPLQLATALTHPLAGVPNKSEQRVMVIGDGDFLSNAFLGNSGNLDLGLRLFTWLTGDDSLISIPARTATDRTLELSNTAALFIGFGFLLVLPLLLVAGGTVIWIKRRKR